MPHDFSTDYEPTRLYIKGGLIFEADGRVLYAEDGVDDRLLCTFSPPELTWPQIREWIDYNFPRAVEA